MSSVNSDLINFIDDYVLDGYGSYNDDIIKTIKHVLVQDGIPMDSIYTGKAYWGMKEYIKKYQINGKKILFIHTGGTPLFLMIWGTVKWKSYEYINIKLWYAK